MDDMIKGMERGLVISRFWYVRLVDPRTIMLTGLTRDGLWWVEKGQIRYPVRNLRFNQSVLAMLAPWNVEAIGAPERRSPLMVPALKLSRLHVHVDLGRDLMEVASAWGFRLGLGLGAWGLGAWRVAIRSVLPDRAGGSLLVLIPLSLSAQRVTRRVFVSAVDETGAPVLNLAAADIRGDRERRAARGHPRASRGNAPMRIVLLVDSSTSMAADDEHFPGAPSTLHRRAAGRSTRSPSSPPAAKSGSARRRAPIDTQLQDRKWDFWRRPAAPTRSSTR